MIEEKNIGTRSDILSFTRSIAHCVTLTGRGKHAMGLIRV